MVCGIAGFVSAVAPDGSGDILRRMTTSIAYRGPNDSGFYENGCAFLGHRRLSIIDLAAGHQPMSNEDGTCWIVYNGEIFNHTDLRGELESAGHRYQTHCDTETILHAYEQYGAECPKRFRGMFSFALWDEKSRTLFCARDRLGIKPFYYYCDSMHFVFGSEIKALLEHPAVRLDVNEPAIEEYLAFGYLSSEETLFRGIRKLMPGHYLRVAPGGTPSIGQYWDVPLGDGARRSDSDWIQETRQRIDEAVRTRLMSDVPLGMFLSGGVDSSAIAAIIKRLNNGPVKTFSVGYPETQYSELSYAGQVARYLGTEHHEVVVSMDDFFNSLPKLIWHEDEPISWPSSVSLYFVSKLASEHVRVVLTGEGSDELFGGYERYRWNMWNASALRAYRVVPKALRSAVRRRIATTHLLRASLRRKLQHTFVGRDESHESLYLDNFYSAFPAEERQKLTGHSGDAYRNYNRHFEHAKGSSLLRRMLYADQKTYLVELLMKQDQMSMAASIESRVPFLDHHLVEFAMSIPDHLKIREGEQKYVLKRAVGDLLPPEIIYRKKMGFPTPIRTWLRSARAKPLFDSVLDPNGFAAAYLDLKILENIVNRYRAGLDDATDRVWRVLNFQLWGDVFFTGRRSERFLGMMSSDTLENVSTL